MAVKLRIPDAWAGRIHSSWVRARLQEFFQRPHALPPDPGAGSARCSLSIPSRAIKVLEGVAGESASAALRRLIAAHAPALPSAPTMAVLASPGPVLGALPPARVSTGIRSGNFAGTSVLSCSESGSGVVVGADPGSSSSVDNAFVESCSWKWALALVVLIGGAILLCRHVGGGSQPLPKPVPELARFKDWIPVGD